MSRLHEPPHPSSPSPRQPALMIGWSELEALLLDRLPPGTVVSGCRIPCLAGVMTAAVEYQPAATTAAAEASAK